MSNKTIPQPTPNDTSVQYGPVFARYLAGALRQSLAQVQEHRYTVPEDVRVQAWHIVRLTLNVDALWEQTSQLLVELAPRMEMAGLREDWIPYLEAGVGRSEMVNDTFSQAEFHYYLGQLYRLVSQNEQARTNLQASEALFAQLDKPEEQAKALNQLAYLAWQKSSVKETLNYAEHALTILPQGHIESAMAYSALGLIAIERFEFHEAETYHRHALEIRGKYNDSRLIAWSLQNLAVALSRQNSFSEAVQCYGEASTLLESIRDRPNQANVYLNLGVAYYYENRFLEALQNYIAAEAIFSELGDITNIARLLVNRGLAHFGMEHYSDAEHCFIQAVRLFSDLGNDALRLNATDGIIMVKIASKDYARAKSLLEQAEVELKTLSDLPNVDYLTKSFADRHKVLAENA